MLDSTRSSKSAQLIVGLLCGICFGFLLQKGGVTTYEIIINQLLLKDFTVVKVMLSAVIVGMIGIYAMTDLGWVNLHPKSGSWSQNLIGGLIFGIGFALLGYCPGTVVGAVGQGSLDALFGGCVGIILGAGLFAALYPSLKEKLLNRGSFGDVTIPSLLKTNHWFVIVPMCIAMIVLLLVLEKWA
jgi:hypothetical protein